VKTFDRNAQKSAKEILKRSRKKGALKIVSKNEGYLGEKLTLTCGLTSFTRHPGTTMEGESTKVRKKRSAGREEVMGCLREN